MLRSEALHCRGKMKFVWIEVWNRDLSPFSRRVSENDLRRVLRCRVTLIKEYDVYEYYDKKLLLVAVPKDVELSLWYETEKRIYQVLG